MPNRKKGAKVKAGETVHIDADEVSVVSESEVPEGHVITEPPTAASPAITMPERDARAAETAEQSETILRTEGQRKINLIWEVTQAVVTILVVSATLYIAGSLVLGSEGDSSNRSAAFLLLSNAFFMIVTAYYQRTNHTRTGGVGGRDVRTDR